VCLICDGMEPAQEDPLWITIDVGVESGHRATARCSHPRRAVCADLQPHGVGSGQLRVELGTALLSVKHWTLYVRCPVGHMVACGLLCVSLWPRVQCDCYLNVLSIMCCRYT
jgi:hypothetical protein